MRNGHWEAFLGACVFAFVPLGMWLLAHFMAGERVMIATEATRELLFFALSMSSTALLGLVDTAHGLLLRICLYVTVIITIFSAAAYGMFLNGEALHAVARMRGAYHVSIAAAITAFLFGALVHYLTNGRALAIANHPRHR
jgi:hypothetical protein